MVRRFRPSQPSAARRRHQGQAALRRWPSAILDGACARRSRTAQVGTKECQSRSNKGIRLREGERSKGFRGGQDTSLPRSEVPTPGRWIRSGRHPGRGIRPRARRLADLSSSNPIRARPRDDPVQKQDPGETDHRKWNQGLTNQGPLQKPGWSAATSGAA